MWTYMCRGEVTKWEIIIMNISPKDKTTNWGAAKVILSLLALYGIITITRRECAKGNTKGLTLDANYKYRFLMIVGDKILQIRETFIRRD